MKAVRRLTHLWLAVGGLLILAACCPEETGVGGERASEPLPFGLTSQLVTPAGNVDAMQLAPDGRLFYAEHWAGDIRIVSPEGTPLPDPFAHLKIAAGVSLGLTGLALDPQFETNHYVYVLYSELVAEGPPLESKPVLARFTDSNNVGTEPTVLINNLPKISPEKPSNLNGSLHFGPDGLLYLTLGDYDRAQELGPNGQPIPQDLGTPIGKMLRVRKEDGSAPPDNPFVSDPSADPRIYAYGFRGAINFTFHPQTGRLYAPDNSGVNCEGIYIVEAGGNYGWPNKRTSDCNVIDAKLPIGLLSQEGHKPADFDSSVGISGLEFSSREQYPILGDSLVYCEVRTQQLRRLVLAAPNLDAITANDAIARDCWLDVTAGPNGPVYYANLSEIRRLIAPTPSPSPAPAPSPSPARSPEPTAR